MKFKNPGRGFHFLISCPIFGLFPGLLIVGNAIPFRRNPTPNHIVGIFAFDLKDTITSQVQCLLSLVPFHSLFRVEIKNSLHHLPKILPSQLLIYKQLLKDSYIKLHKKSPKFTNRRKVFKIKQRCYFFQRGIQNLHLLYFERYIQLHLPGRTITLCT